MPVPELQVFNHNTDILQNDKNLRLTSTKFCLVFNPFAADAIHISANGFS